MRIKKGFTIPSLTNNLKQVCDRNVRGDAVQKRYPMYRTYRIWLVLSFHKSSESIGSDPATAFFWLTLLQDMVWSRCTITIWHKYRPGPDIKQTLAHMKYNRLSPVCWLNSRLVLLWNRRITWVGPSCSLGLVGVVDRRLIWPADHKLRLVNWSRIGRVCLNLIVAARGKRLMLRRWNSQLTRSHNQD